MTDMVVRIVVGLIVSAVELSVAGQLLAPTASLARGTSCAPRPPRDPDHVGVRGAQLPALLPFSFSIASDAKIIVSCLL